MESNWYNLHKWTLIWYDKDRVNHIQTHLNDQVLFDTTFGAQAVLCIQWHLNKKKWENI